MKSLYDFAQIVDAVLERPDEVVQTEVRSVLRLGARHKIAGGQVLELACGACAHGLSLAREGFQVVGIDRSAAMLAEAQRRANLANTPIHTVQGDVVDFDLGVSDFDVAILMFETFPLITAYRDIVNHFNAVRRHMKQRGIYIVDVDAARHGVRTKAGEWGRRTLPLPDGCVETWYEDLPGDWVEGTNRMILRCRICLGDQVYETRDQWNIRVYNPWILALLAKTLDGWQLEGCFSWRDLSADIANEDHYLAVFVAS